MISQFGGFSYSSIVSNRIAYVFKHFVDWLIDVLWLAFAGTEEYRRDESLALEYFERLQNWLDGDHWTLNIS